MAGAVVALSLATSIAWAQGSKLNDAQIAHIAYTADQIDIQAGQLALEKSNNNEVRAFAQDMVRDHTAVNEKALALVKKLNVTPEDNNTSQALSKQATDKRAELARFSILIWMTAAWADPAQSMSRAAPNVRPCLGKLTAENIT